MGLLRRLKDWLDVSKWERAGCPDPPPHPIKQRVLREHAQRFGLDVLVETGTFTGHMIASMKDDFRKLYSIELADHYHPSFYSMASQMMVCVGLLSRRNYRGHMTYSWWICVGMGSQRLLMMAMTWLPWPGRCRVSLQVYDWKSQL